MGNPKFWYQPTDSGETEEVEFASDFLSNFQEIDPLVLQSTSRSISGHTTTVSWGLARRYRISIERFVGRSDERAFRNFLTHAMLGGEFGFSVDADKSFAAFASSPSSVDRGDSAIVHSGYQFWDISPSLSSGDEVVILSGYPDTRSEINTISAVTSSTVALQNDLVYDYADSDFVFVRWRYYFPYCRIPENNRSTIPLTNDRFINFSFDMVIEEDIGALSNFSNSTGWDPSSLGVNLRDVVSEDTREVLTSYGRVTRW